MRTAIVLCVVFLVAGAVLGQQGFPQTMSYQGVLRHEDGSAVPDGEYEITFRLYDSEAARGMVWEETQLVPVEVGVFNALLGAVAPLDLPFDRTYWLGVTIGPGGIELTPRTELAATGYSLTARTVVDEAVTTPKLADGAVTEDKLAAGAVTTEAIQDATIGLADIAQNGAEPWQVLKWTGSEWIMEDDFGVEGPIAAVYGDSGLVGYGYEGAVGLSIATEGVEEHMLSSGAVTTDKIEDGTIEFDDIGQNEVWPGQIMKWSGGRGTWVASVDSVGVASVVAGEGLTGGGGGREVVLDVEPRRSGGDRDEAGGRGGDDGEARGERGHDGEAREGRRDRRQARGGGSERRQDRHERRDDGEDLEGRRDRRQDPAGRGRLGEDPRQKHRVH